MSDNVVSASLPAEDLPNLRPDLFKRPAIERLMPAAGPQHAPRFLLLRGSRRERSYSRLAVEEAGRLLRAMGAEVRMFNPAGLPLPDDAPDTHPKVEELHNRDWTLHRKLSLAANPWASRFSR